MPLRRVQTARFRLRAALAAVLLGILPLICQPAKGQMLREVDLQGRIRTNQGLTLPSGIRVEVDTNSGVSVAQQLATPNGEFFFPGLPKGIYSITITAQGFQTYQRSLDLTLTGNSYFLDVFLTPANRQTPGPEAMLSRTDRLAPRKAKKEELKGEQLLAQRKLAPAEAHFAKAAALYPCYARAQAHLALLLEGDQKSPQAAAGLRKGIQCDPDFLQSYIELGALLNDEKDYPGAKTILQDGLRRAPAAWEFYYQLGLADFGLNDAKQAAAEFVKAEQFNKTPPPILYVRLANAYVRESAYSDAYAAFKDYLRSDPNGPYAVRVKAVIQRMVAAGLVAPAPPNPSPKAAAGDTTRNSDNAAGGSKGPK